MPPGENVFFPECVEMQNMKIVHDCHESQRMKSGEIISAAVRSCHSIKVLLISAMERRLTLRD